MFTAAVFGASHPALCLVDRRSPSEMRIDLARVEQFGGASEPICGGDIPLASLAFWIPLQKRAMISKGSLG